jgi:hypothetical protein
MGKKTWIKPQLISLARCQPPEAVLSVCKYGSGSGDPTNYCTGCVQFAAPASCDECDLASIS